MTIACTVEAFEDGIEVSEDNQGTRHFAMGTRMKYVTINGIGATGSGYVDSEDMVYISEASVV